MNSVRLYDNGLVEYLKQNITVDDGEDDGRKPQVIFASPSKKALVGEINKSKYIR